MVGDGWVVDDGWGYRGLAPNGWGYRGLAPNGWGWLDWVGDMVVEAFGSTDEGGTRENDWVCAVNIGVSVCVDVFVSD